MDNESDHLVSSYSETKSYFSYGGENIRILPKFKAFLSQYDNCLFVAPLSNKDNSSSLPDSVIKEALLNDIDLDIGESEREVLCILDSNEDNLHNGKRYNNRCVVALGGISRFAVNPTSDLLFVVFSNNILCIYSFLSDKENWVYLHALSTLKIHNNIHNVNTICVNENNEFCFGLMEGTVMVYGTNRFNYSFKLKNSPITLLKHLKSKILFICYRSGDVYLYDLKKRVKIMYFKDNSTYVKSLNYIITKNNEIGLITLDNDNVINLWSWNDLNSRNLSSNHDHDSTNDLDDIDVIIDNKTPTVIPFKRIIKTENITSVEVVTTRLNEDIDSKKKGSWLLLVVEESGKVYYQDPVNDNILHKNELMYGFGLVKSVEYTSDIIMLLGINGSILIYDKLLKPNKLLLSNFNNLFQFSLLNSSLSESMDLDVDDLSNPVTGDVEDNYKYTINWYNNNLKRTRKMMLILVGDEVLRILLLNSTNEFIPVGLSNTAHTHRDSITAMHYNAQYNMLLTGSKDKLIILWDLKRLMQLKMINTIYIITSLLINPRPQSKTVDIIASTHNIINLYSVKSHSEDLSTVKNENKTDSSTGDNVDKSNHTSVVHKTNINYLTMSHNQKYISSCSNDKVIVVHYSNNLTVKGRCVGHRKAVLYSKFMTLTKTLVSSSMDQTIRLWNLTNFTNIKTFEGHKNSIMKVISLDNNLQLLSCGLDGFIKLWNVPTSECISTFSTHNDESVWDIELSNNVLYSASNNLIVVHEDSSKEEMRLRVLKEHEEEVVTSQVNSLLLKDNFRDSLVLSIRLNNIKLTNDILLKFTNKTMFQGLKTEEDPVDYVIQKISESDGEEKKRLLDNLLTFIKTWISNRKDYLIANVFINKLLKKLKLEELLNVEGLVETIDYFLYNISHHQNRLESLQEKSYLLDMLTHDNVHVDSSTTNKVLYNS